MKLFAEVVEIDYRSLGAPEVTQDKNSQLQLNWKAVLPGFDKTVHTITNLKINISGDSADCDSDINAYHLLKGCEGGDDWILIGKYKHHLIKKDGVWTIDKMGLFDLKQEGNLKLLVSAATKTATLNK